ncbi:MAG: hypothetical protein M4579_004270 [Chaenotheca gracillima]|nr:MAG: hypothetical protein M4579_004270 [Chaenotheca gracillima]
MNMEYETPPTYEAATSPNVLPVIAEYVPLRDQLSACMVSKRWYAAFIPVIWRYAVFQYKESVLERMLDYIDRLEHTKPETRRLVRHFVVRGAQAPLYEVQENALWLAKVLNYLPYLQSLSLVDFALLDADNLFYAITQAQQAAQERTLPDALIPPGTYPLKMLSLVNCRNAVPQRLGKLLLYFTELAYLDLSGTAAARHPSVMKCVLDEEALPALQVLKLRRINLNPDYLQKFAIRVTKGVFWSLDLSDNNLPDKLTNYLLDYSFPPPLYDATHPPSYEKLISRSTSYYHQWELMDEESHFFNVWMAQKGVDESFSSRSEGLSHLYLSGNQLTQESHALLIKTSRLRVIHLGSPKDEMAMGGIYDLDGEPDRLLTQLRVHHHFITLAARALNQKHRDLNELPRARTILDQLYPCLRTLILTDVLPTSPESHVMFQLERFIRQCATMEAGWAKEEWHHEHGADATPNVPGLYPPSTLFKRFDTLVIELAPFVKGSSRKDLSVTEDLDSDNFMKESAGDFSFFDDFKPDKRSELSKKPSRTPAYAEKSPWKPEPDPKGFLKWITAFRTERRQAHANAAKSQLAGAGTHEHWSGTIILLSETSRGLPPPSFIKAQPGWTCRYV